MLGCRGVLGGRRFGLGVLQRRESHRADDSVAIRKLGWSCGPWRCCCADRRRRESVRAARGCAVQWRVHAARWALPCAKGRAEGVVRACRARVVLGAKMVPELAAKLASLRGNAADQASGVSIKTKLGPSRWSIFCGTHTRATGPENVKIRTGQKCTSETSFFVGLSARRTRSANL